MVMTSWWPQRRGHFPLEGEQPCPPRHGPLSPNLAVTLESSSTPWSGRPGSQEQGLHADGDHLGTPILHACSPNPEFETLGNLLLPAADPLRVRETSKLRCFHLAEAQRKVRWKRYCFSSFLSLSVLSIQPHCWRTSRTPLRALVAGGAARRTAGWGAE